MRIFSTSTSDTEVDQEVKDYFDRELGKHAEELQEGTEEAATGLVIGVIDAVARLLNARW